MPAEFVLMYAVLDEFSAFRGFAVVCFSRCETLLNKNQMQFLYRLLPVDLQTGGIQ